MAGGGGGFASIIMTLATVYILIKFVMPMALDLAKEIPAHLPDLKLPAPAPAPEATPAPAPEATPAPAETTPAPEAAESGGGDGGGGEESGGGDSGGGGGGGDSEESGGGSEDSESNYGTILNSNYIPVNWT